MRIVTEPLSPYAIDTINGWLDQQGVDATVGTTVSKNCINIVCGRSLCETVLGKDVVKRSTAYSKYKTERAVHRSSWHNYVYALEDSCIVVTCLDLKQLTKGFTALPAIRAAFSHAMSLEKGAPIFDGTEVSVYQPSKWPLNKKDRPLCIDTETVGDRDICRIGLNDGYDSGTFDWSVATSQLIDNQTFKAPNEEKRTLVAHHAIFDWEVLLKAKVLTPRQRWWCTMTAAALLFPGSRKGLGHAVPLMVPTSPWKHKAQEDPEGYNMKDTNVLAPLHQLQYYALQQQGMLDLFLQIEMPAAWLFYDLEKRGYHVKGTKPGARTTAVSSQYRPVQEGNGAYSTVTGRMEARKPSLPAPFGQRSDVELVASSESQGLFHAALRNPYLQIARSLTGDPLLGKGPQPTRRRLLLLNRGPIQQARELPDVTAASAKKSIDLFAQSSPAYVAWSSNIKARAKKEGFIANPFGRRAYGLRGEKAIGFMLHSTVSDCLIQLALNVQEIGLIALTPEGMLFEAPLDHVRYKSEEVTGITALTKFNAIAPDFTLDLTIEVL